MTESAIPIEVIGLVVEYHTYLLKSFLLIELSFQHHLYKLNLKYLDCHKGYFVVSRKFGSYTRKTIIQDEFGKVSIRQYNCITHS